VDEKRYQVFVSSTYRDLIEHRQLVMKALLQVNAIPAGMELFPASDDDAWTLIQRAIDESDYYVVIVGGKYGSTDENGVSYTEREFDYASERQKPIMAFLHKSVDILPRGKTETDATACQKLDRFRQKAEEKHCKYWTTPEELTIAVLTSYHHLLHTKPATGWVRGDRAKTIEELEQLTKAQDTVRELEVELGQYRKQQAAELSLFAQGTEPLTLHFTYFFGKDGQDGHTAEFTWDDIFRVVAQQILNDPTEEQVRLALDGYAKRNAPPRGASADLSSFGLRLSQDDLDTIKLQFLGLHLITVDHFTTRHEPPKSEHMWIRLPSTIQTEVLWKLTARGSDYLARLAAVRRTPRPEG